MKNYLKCFFVLMVCLLMCSCVPQEENLQDNDATLQYTSGTPNTTTGEKNPNYIYSSEGYIVNYYNTLNKVVDDDNNYQVFSDERGINQRYYVFDNYGNLLDEGYNSNGIEFIKNENIMTLVFHVDGNALERYRYYDLENGKVSRFYTNSLCTYNERIVYFTKDKNDDIVLIVRNMFDSSAFYKEIRRNFSNLVLLSDSPAEFIGNGSKLRISYRTVPNDEIITEDITM